NMEYFFDQGYIAECRIFRLYLQLDDKINAEYWIKKALYQLEDVVCYLKGFRLNIKELGLIYRSLIANTNSKTQEALERIYKCYTQAADLLDKMESFIKMVQN